ncbi:MAG TPA: hypothetical protein VFU86_22345 [Terriglobales bacterium]|nr:hypothetical protein [Terriglobales bacterium]
MHLSGLDLLFWVAGLLGHTLLLFIIVQRKRAESYPIFTSLIIVNILRTIALYFVLHYGTRAQYFDTYWSLAIVDASLQIGVVYELAAGTFRPLGSWARDVRPTLIALGFASLVVAAILTFWATPPSKRWIQAVVIKGNFFSEVCISELFVIILWLSVTSGLPMKTHASRISQGFGVYSIIDLGIEAGHSYFGVGGSDHSYIALSHVRMLAYLGCVCFWITTLWPDEPPKRYLTDEMRSQLAELQRQLRGDSQEPRFRKGPRA